MIKGESRPAKKVEYFDKLHANLTEYNKILIVNLDNVTSKQINDIRRETRGQLCLQMGKKTLIRCAINKVLKQHPQLEKILPLIRGNVGFVFTNGDLRKARDLLVSNKVAAPAKAGTIAPCSVTVPKGNTGMGPEKTSFFQALGISTKITKGTVEIVNDVQVIKEGDKVGQSEAALLSLLKIYPFTYGLTLKHVYDGGDLYDPSLLDITDDHIEKCVREAINRVACVSLATHHLTLASATHVFMQGYKRVIAASLPLEYTFKQKDLFVKAIEASKHAPAAPAHHAPASPSKGSKAAPAKAPEPEEEEDEDMGFGLFD